MLNRFQFNESNTQLAQGGFNQMTIPEFVFEVNDDIVFNDYGLQNTSVITEYVNDQSPTREVSFARLPYLDGELFNSEYFRKKIITLKGRITKSTRALLEAELDLFKQAMCEPNAYLDIARTTAGTKRRYYATLTNPESMFIERQQSDITSVPFTLVFEAHEGFSYNKDYTNQVATGTSLITNFTVWNTGTFETPVWFIINCTTVNTITAMLIENLTTGESVLLTTAIVNGDLIEIDGITKEVTLNSTAKDFDGFFPSLAVGANLFRITFTGTSVTSATITAKMKNRYL